MDYLFYLINFILGTCIGSFINVVVDRTARGEELNGRSHCENCDKKLKILDLVPILSYIFLQGKCRYCKTKLSIQYPLVEFVTGCIFLFIFVMLSKNQFNQVDYLNNATHVMDYGIWIPLIFYYVTTTALIILFLTDLKYGMLYDKIMLPAIAFVLIYKVATIGYYLIMAYLGLSRSSFGQMLLKVGYLTSRTQFAITPFVYTLVGSIIIALFFLLLIIVTRGRGMGGGDLKLGFLIGLLSGWPNMFVSIFLGFLTGALVSCILLLLRKKNLRQTVPFGPFLILGSFVVTFYGNQIFEWYSKTLIGIK